MDQPNSWDKNSEKYLVAEQPAWNIIFSGVVFSLFMGLVIRAVFSPDRVREHIEKAAQQIHKNAQVSFSQARISLADGLLPELAVVVRDIRLESQDPCVMRPLVEVDEMKLPLSFSKLLLGEIFIDRILVHEMNLSLNELGSHCAVETKPAASYRKTEVPRPEVSQSISGNSVGSSFSEPNSAVGEIVTVKPEYPIHSIEVRTLNIHYLPVAFTSFYFRDLQIKLQNESPLLAEIEGVMMMAPDSRYTNLGSTQIKMIYDEGQEQKIQLSMKGGISEGSFAFEAQSSVKKKDLHLQGEIHYFPISQIQPLLKKYRILQSEFNGKRVWLSGKIDFHGELQNLEKSPMKLSQIKLEGDLGEISASNLEVMPTSPLKFKPFEMEVRRLSLNEAKKILNWEHPSPIFGSLGEFNGIFHYEGVDRWALRGDHLGLEFIFSNRGVRKNQVISLISGELENREGRLIGKIDRIRPHEGVLEGEIKIVLEPKVRSLNLDAKIREFSLSPVIQALMTGGGSMSALNGDLQINLTRDRIERMKAQVKMKEMVVDGISMTDPRLSIDHKQDLFRFQITAQNLTLDPQSQSASDLQEIFVNRDRELFLIRNPKLVGETQNFKTLTWNDFQGDSAIGKIHSQGGWDLQGNLQGFLKISSKTNQEWMIRGQRSHLSLVKK